MCIRDRTTTTGPGGTGGSEKLDSSNQARHTQGREKRRPSTINVVGKNNKIEIVYTSGQQDNKLTKFTLLVKQMSTSKKRTFIVKLMSNN